MTVPTMPRVQTILKVALVFLWLAGLPLAQPQDNPAERNFDGRARYNQVFAAVSTVETQKQAVEALQAGVPGLLVTYDEDTGVTRTLYNRSGYLTGRRLGVDPLTVAVDFIESNYPLLGLTENDLAEFEVTDTVTSEVTGATHIYLNQFHRGLPVYNGQVQIHINRDGRIMGINNAAMPHIAQAVKTMRPALAPGRAVASAARHLGIDLQGVLPRALTKETGPQQVTSLSHQNLSLLPIDARLMLLPVRRGEARLVWNFQIHTLDEEHGYDFTVDAANGEIWTRFDWVQGDQYRVYAMPAESPIHTAPAPPADGRVLVVDPADPTASPRGWHDTGGASYTRPRGNNVHAYEDRDGNNSPPSSEPICSGSVGSLTCDFPMNLGQAPSNYIGAAVANLFYWNNIVHDVQYLYGFDEAAGNFQVNNFGKGGLSGDDVRAEAQDGGGTNNANFFTPPDGQRPRMQMYLWNLTNPNRDGDLDNGIVIHEYGHGVSIRQVGGPSNSSCLSNNQQPGEGWSDYLALVYTVEDGDRGTDPRGIGTYALGQPTSGAGIRTQRYSTDPAVNTHTYESIRGKTIPHGVGEVWAQALWEVYWALVDRHGLDLDLYDISAAAGNHRALLYMNEGLKNTACSPTFTDARDGILQVAMDNYGGEDVCLLWETFAAFGLGVDAVSGGSNSTNPTNGFQVPAECQCQPLPIVDAGPDQNICLGDSVTLGTTARSGHSYTWSPGGQTTAQISVSPTTTTTYTLTASTTCGSAQDQVTVLVDDGTGGGMEEDFEGGASGWTTTGLWHLAQNSQCASPGYSSPVHAFYFGQDSTCSYNTGATVSGELTSPEINGITSDSTLSFDFFRQVESYSGGAYDRTEVQVLTESGSTVVFSLDSRNTSTAGWLEASPISLSGFAGETIRIRFRFDTVDAVSNNFTGWLIDDVIVTGTSGCTITNQKPQISITSPNDGMTVAEGTLISFAGSASDSEDGDLTSSLQWSSSRDGTLGSGGSFSAVLSVGAHTITASATDSGGLTGSSSITAVVNANTAPTVMIGTPPDGSTFIEGGSVTFTGTAFDAEDGDLTADVEWTSSLDGVIGSGGSFSTSTLSVGVHTVTAKVIDLGLLEGSAAISIRIASEGGTEVIDWNVTTTVAYSNQDGSGTITVEDAGVTFLMEGNRWRRTTESFTITPFTVLELEFQSSSQGEIHGIGFDEDDTLTNDLRIFQLFGTQNWASAIQLYRGDYSSVGTFVTYRIPVGAFYTGSGFRLVLVNDKDSGTLGNTSRFRNVRIFENPPNVAPLDFNVVTTSSYSNQDVPSSGTLSVEDGGSTFFMTGNRWRKSDASFTLTPDTVVAFEFQSTSQGEIHGLGFDEDDNLTNAARLFRIFGTQSWTADIDWLQAYTTGEIGTFKTFVIPVGRYYNGSGFRLLLSNDRDASPFSNTSRFRDVRIYELK